MNKPRRQTWPHLDAVSVSFKHLHWRIISYFPLDEMPHVLHHRVTCSIIMLLILYPFKQLGEEAQRGVRSPVTGCNVMAWQELQTYPGHRSEVWGVNNSATTPPCVVSSTQTSKWTNHWQLTILYFFLFKTEIDKKKNRLLYLYLHKDCFQSFF